MRKFILALALLLFTSTAFSAVKWVNFDYFNNTGGLNDGFAETAIEDNEASDIQNVVLSTYGSFKTRDGYEKLNGTTLGAAVDINGGAYFSPTSGSQYLVIVTSDNKVYKMDYGGSGPDGTWDDITGTLSFTVTQDNLASFATGQDTLIIEDGLNSTPPYKWTGTGNAELLGGTPANATMVAFHKNMAFCAGNSAAPSTLYFSDVGDIENWTTGISGNVAVETNDGTEIRALAVGFDSLYIFKDSSIWRLTGDDKDNFRLQRMVSGVGVKSPKAVSRIGNDFYIVSSQGTAYLYDGAITLKKLSTKVQGTIDTSNFSRWAYAVTEQFKDNLYVAFSNTGSNTHDRMLMFDSFNLAWTKFIGINANAMFVADDGTGEDMLVFGDYSGFVYKYPSGTNDAGTAINAYYTTKQFRFPQVAPLKDWKLLKVYATEESDYYLDVETRKDFESAGTTTNMHLLGDSSLFGTAVYGTDRFGGTAVVTERIEVNKEGTFFQIKFSNDNLDEPFEVRGFQIFVEGQDRY